MLSFACKLRRKVTRGLTQGGIADVSKASRFIPLPASRILRRPEPNRRQIQRWDLASNLLLLKHEEINCMQYFVFAIGAGAIVQLAARAYKLVERWDRRRRLRGAQECLDAVQNTLAGLAECKSYSKNTRTTLP
jgi:hypothetical protein